MCEGGGGVGWDGMPCGSMELEFGTLGFRGRGDTYFFAHIWCTDTAGCRRLLGIMRRGVIDER